MISLASGIDEVGLWDSLPTFCAANRSRVPDIPDELTDIAAISYETKTGATTARMSDVKVYV